MRKFQYVEPLDERMEPVTITVSEEWIRRMYYPHWKKLGKKVMKQRSLYNYKYQEQFSEVNLSFERCLSDFMTIHWAWELK